jgi:flagellar basal body rod protein FlgG
MNISFYTGASGLMAYQNEIDVIGHNIANVNTTGYKSTKASFRDLIYSNMDANINRELEQDDKNKVGHGVKFAGQDMLFTQGILQSTGYALDFAIAGEGLFAVENEENIEYTRNGNFDISIEDGENYLVTSDGSYVLDRNGEHAKILYDDYGSIDSSAIAESLAVYTFDNPYGLQRTDRSSFLVTDISGQPVMTNLSHENRIYTSTLENSNVDIAKEMSDMIVSQKAYQFSAKVVQVADELEEVANSLRR